MRNLKKGITFILLMVSCMCWAESNPPETEPELKWEFSLFVDYLMLDDQQAVDQGIGDDGFTISGEFSYFVIPNLYLGAGGGLVVLDDNDSFTQDVEVVGGFNHGDRSTESSEVTGLSGFVELGTRYSLGDKWALGLAGGYNYIDVDREIPDCTNCRSDEVDLDGGGYILPSATVFWTEKIRSTLGYSYYLSGDIDSAIRLALQWGF